jgi:asparagine synthetase B (glutamine-hydrolysing)
VSGIAGLLGTDDAHDASAVMRAARQLDARGPDARVTMSAPGAFLAVTVLAPGESEPAIAASRDGRWWALCDGEALNLDALRVEVGADGRSTPQVLALLAERVGPARAFERIEGGMAAVLWDAHARVAWLRRDRMGHRTLFHASSPDGRLAVASSPDALRTMGGSAAPVELAPGETAEVRADGVRRAMDADEGLNPAGSGGSAERWARSVRFAAHLAVRRRLASGEPVALCLSGGAYAAALALMLSELRVPARAYAVEDAQASAAEALAGRLGIPFRMLTASEVEPRACIQELSAAGVARGDATDAGRWALARVASEGGARILLSGDGGSGLFGGTSDVLAARLGPLARLLGPRAAAIPAGGATAEPPSGPAAARALWSARREVASRTLPMLDRIAAAHGLRAHAPFADDALVRIAAQVPIGLVVPLHPPRPLFHASFPEVAAVRASPFPAMIG